MARASFIQGRRGGRRLLLVVVITLLAVAAVGGAIASSRSAKAEQAPPDRHVTLRVAGAAPRIGPKQDPAAETLTRIGSPRVRALSLIGDTVLVTGRASDSAGDAARTRWYLTVAGAAFAQQVGATRIKRKVFTETGALARDDETRAYTSTSGRDWFAPPIFSAADVETGTSARAISAGARVVETHYIRLFSGIAEIVVKPDDEAQFMGEYDTRLFKIVGELGKTHRPYLVTVVDSQLKPRLVLGFTPGVGPPSVRAPIGTGTAWQAPDVDVLGSTLSSR